MANPVMNQLDQQWANRTPAGYPTMPGYQPGQRGQAQQGYGQGYDQQGYAQPQQQYQQPQDYQAPEAQYGQQVPVEDFERAYNAPSADDVDRGVMTYDDVIMKTGILFGVLLLGAVGSYMMTLFMPSVGLMVGFVALLAGFVLAMVNIFKKAISPALIGAYAAAEGIFLGSFSAIMEFMYRGIVVQAVLATFAVVGVTLALFASGKVRNSPKLQRIVLIGLIGLIVYRVLSAILVWTGVIVNPWGIDGMTVMGIPLGILVGAFAVVMGAISLIGDFDIAKHGVEARVPKVFAWRVGFGIMVTVVWLYLEILRLLAILREN